ncbi:MAG: SHOCT domain-containing protein [Candidatus Dormiibacterota bacterium]
MGRDVVKWLGALFAVVGSAGFAYGFVVLISNGNCGCSSDGFCSGPPCPPADNLGFLGLFAGIWIAVIGIIMMSVAASRAKAAKGRQQFAGGTGAYTGSPLASPAGTPGAAGLTFASMGGSFGATPGAPGTALATVVPDGPGFALPGANAAPAPGSAEAILAADAAAGVPSQQAAPGDATGRLQELDALKAQGVVNDAEYAAQRQRILDSI